MSSRHHPHRVDVRRHAVGRPPGLSSSTRWPSRPGDVPDAQALGELLTRHAGDESRARGSGRLACGKKGITIVARGSHTKMAVAYWAGPIHDETVTNVPTGS
jgi:hypothetical protein